MPVSAPVSRSFFPAISEISNGVKDVRTTAKLGGSILNVMGVFESAAVSTPAGKAVGRFFSTVKDVLGVPSTLGLFTGPSEKSSSLWKTAANVSGMVASTIETVGYLSKAGILQLSEVVDKMNAYPFLKPFAELPYFNIMVWTGTASAFFSAGGNVQRIAGERINSAVIVAKKRKWEAKTLEGLQAKREARIAAQTILQNKINENTATEDERALHTRLVAKEKREAKYDELAGGLEAHKIKKITEWKNAEVQSYRAWGKASFDLMANVTKVASFVVGIFGSIAAAYFSFSLFYVGVATAALGLASNAFKFAGAYYAAARPIPAGRADLGRMPALPALPVGAAAAAAVDDAAAG